MQIDDDGTIQAGADELGVLLGVSARRVQQMETANIVESIAHGIYDVASSVRGYCEYLRGQTLGTEATKEERTERIRLTKAKAGIAELSHQELLGDLVRRSAIRAQDAALGNILRSNLETIPDRVSAILAAESDQDEVHRILLKENRDSLEAVIEAMGQTNVDTAQLDRARQVAREAVADD